MPWVSYVGRYPVGDMLWVTILDDCCPQYTIHSEFPTVSSPRYRVTNLARGSARIVINIFLINQWECQPFAGAWQLIQEWFVSCTSTHIITQTPQILRFFIRYNNYQYTYIILCFYVRFTSCCVQNLTHCTLPDKVSGTGIFD